MQILISTQSFERQVEKNQNYKIFAPLIHLEKNSAITKIFHEINEKAIRKIIKNWGIALDLALERVRYSPEKLKHLQNIAKQVFGEKTLLL